MAAQNFDEVHAATNAALDRLFAPGANFGEVYMSLMADFVRFKIIGTGMWSDTWSNKAEFLRNLLHPIMQEVVSGFSMNLENRIVEGNWACVETTGGSQVRNGMRYDNEYAYVFRFADGKIVQGTEYLDTELATQCFGFKDQHLATPLRGGDALSDMPSVHPSSYDVPMPENPNRQVQENKAIVRAMFADPTSNKIEAYRAAMADDVEYRIMGKTRFSGTFKGWDAFMKQVVEPLATDLDEGGLNVVADNIFASEDWVVAQCRGLSKTRLGRRYDNDYCLLYRFDGGRIVEVREYLDTELVTFAFGNEPLPQS